MKVETASIEAGDGIVTFVINRDVQITMTSKQAEYLFNMLPDAILISRMTNAQRDAINRSPSNRALVKRMEANGIIRQGARIR